MMPELCKTFGMRFEAGPLGMMAGIAFAAVAVVVTGARADDASGWIVTLGGGVEYGPSYEGASQSSASFVPSFDVRRIGEPDTPGAPDDNFDLTLFEFQGVEIGSVTGFRGSRKASDDPSLQGLHDIRWSIDTGAFAQYWLVEDKLRLRAEVRQGLRRNDGLVADIGADWFGRVGDDLILSAGPRISFANTTYMRNDFGVSAEEAANGAVLPAYDARGGAKSVGLTVSATYRLTDTTSIELYDKYDRLIGDAADSPIVTSGGSANQNVIGLSLSHAFAIKF